MYEDNVLHVFNIIGMLEFALKQDYLKRWLSWCVCKLHYLKDDSVTRETIKKIFSLMVAYYMAQPASLCDVNSGPSFLPPYSDQMSFIARARLQLVQMA